LEHTRNRDLNVRKADLKNLELGL
jgi:hypothetical protein